MLLTVEKITKSFRVSPVPFGVPAAVNALKEVSFELDAGRTLGIVGESGCGKTTLARILVGLIKPDAGSVSWDTQFVMNFRKDVQMIFQNPYNSLDPRMRIVDAVAQPLLIHRICRGGRVKDAVVRLLADVGLPADVASRYPSQLSGGQRQRICIARALATEPRVLILDEPVSSLDLTVQDAILDLLIALKSRMGLTYIFISHNLALVRYLADDVMVMYRGTVVERGGSEGFFRGPAHEYSRELLKAARE